MSKRDRKASKDGNNAGDKSRGEQGQESAPGVEAPPAGAAAKPGAGSAKWDPTKDVLVRTLRQREPVAGKEPGLRVVVRAYAGGPEKVCIERFGATKRGEPWYTSVSRLTLEEARWVFGAGAHLGSGTP